MTSRNDPKARPASWSQALHSVLARAGVRQVAYVPDASHTELLGLLEDDPNVRLVPLTTEEEGIALAAGAWLGGQRALVLMQSSGVGNCVNMLSLAAAGRFPLLLLVTMRGEWAEENPSQVPMGRAARPVLEAMGVTVYRVEAAEDVAETVGAAATSAFESDQQVAVLLGQRLLGRKRW